MSLTKKQQIDMVQPFCHFPYKKPFLKAKPRGMVYKSCKDWGDQIQEMLKVGPEVGWKCVSKGIK